MRRRGAGSRGGAAWCRTYARVPLWHVGLVGGQAQLKRCSRIEAWAATMAGRRVAGKGVGMDGSGAERGGWEWPATHRREEFGAKPDPVAVRVAVRHLPVEA